MKDGGGIGGRESERWMEGRKEGKGEMNFTRKEGKDGARKSGNMEANKGGRQMKRWDEKEAKKGGEIGL